MKRTILIAALFAATCSTAMASDFRVSFSSYATAYGRVDRMKMIYAGETPVNITDIIINNNPKCMEHAYFMPKVFAMGDVGAYTIECEPIKVVIVTDQGTVTLKSGE